MRAMVRIAIIVTLMLDLAGCYSIIKMPDLATAAVYGPNVSNGSLSPQQLARLSNWVKAHNAGWRGLTRTPSAPVSMAIVMHDPNGRQSSLDLFELKDGSATAYFYAPSPALPLERYVSDTDVATLKAAVGN